MDKNKFDTLKKLIYVVGPTGFETEIMETFTELIEPYVDEIEEDNVGNVYAKLEGNRDNHIMIHAHADTIGWMVKFIDDKGFIFTDDISGPDTVDHRMMPGQEVLVECRKLGTPLTGYFIPTMPIHLLDEDDDDQERHDLAIDMGFDNGNLAKKAVSVGDTVIFKPSLKYCGPGNRRVIGTSLDDRVGLLTLIELAKRFKNYKNKPTITFVATVTEEGWGNIVTQCANKIDPDLAICVDVYPATDCIVNDDDDSIAKKYGSIKLGGGSVITRGIGVDEEAFGFVEDISKKKGLPIQLSISEGDTETINTYKNGSKSILVAIPCRNCHTNVEVVHDKDINNTIELCVQLIKKY